MDEERIFNTGDLPARHALDITLLHAVDVAAHHHVQHVFLTFGNAGDGLNEAVSVVPVPANQLLFGDVGHTQQHAVVAHIPDNRVRDLLVRNVCQLFTLEQVRTEQRQIIGGEPVRIQGVAERRHPVSACLHVDGAVPNHHRRNDR
ncbi:DUF2607 family protein [Pseudomonas chlororaphis]|nr:DUF2607 family protein [Pseudomonas chlororaphis]MBP5138640.1 DUF2607 family protein [Pseudomonas chlororaphis]QTU03995.1 DUF2607 family protein [Pseudomonas chlororaphis]